MTGILGQGDGHIQPGHHQLHGLGRRGCPTTSGTCSRNFRQRHTVTLTAQPAANVTFNGWSGAPCGGTGANCVLTVTQTSRRRSRSDPQLRFNSLSRSRETAPASCRNWIFVEPQAGLCDQFYESTEDLHRYVSSNHHGEARDIREHVHRRGRGVQRNLYRHECLRHTHGRKSQCHRDVPSPGDHVRTAGGNGSGRVTSSIGGIDCAFGPSPSGTCLATYRVHVAAEHRADRVALRGIHVRRVDCIGSDLSRHRDLHDHLARVLPARDYRQCSVLDTPERHRDQRDRLRQRQIVARRRRLQPNAECRERCLRHPVRTGHVTDADGNARNGLAIRQLGRRVRREDDQHVRRSVDSGPPGHRDVHACAHGVDHRRRRQRRRQRREHEPQRDHQLHHQRRERRGNGLLRPGSVRDQL